MRIFVDSSIWIDYFKSGNNSEKMDSLISENLIVTNDIILVELIPFLKVKGKTKVMQMLNEVDKLKLNIDWKEIINFQTNCLKSGINGVGIPDLIIAQNVKQNDCKIYSIDKHFKWMESIVDLKIL